MREKIDFVITWVDGSDPAWQKSRETYLLSERECGKTAEDARPERYRDWGILRYLFRGISMYAPWVHRVFFVTDGQRPSWLDLSCKKLKLVRHEDFMRAENLPTFNSNAVEVNLHRIPGLSEKFVYFNDDMFLTAPVRPGDFFDGGLPVDMLAVQPVIANPKNPVMSRILLNDSLAISRHFDKWQTMRAHPGAYWHIGYPAFYFIYNALERVFPQYTGFYTVHGPSPLCKHTFEEVWEAERPVLEETSARRFRSADDVTQYLFREWQKQKGAFSPRNMQKDTGYFELSNDNRALGDALLHRKKKFICVNDPSNAALDTGSVKKQLHAFFEAAFPKKSEFEF